MLGGGVAGLTAAHELIERGFAVTVFDAVRPQIVPTPVAKGQKKPPPEQLQTAGELLGGKARSFAAPLTSELLTAFVGERVTDEYGKECDWDVRKRLPKETVDREEAKLRRSETLFPTEHGFHYFPGFYRHVTDTLSRIPVGAVELRTKTVADRLVTGSRVLIARQDPPAEISFRRSVQSASDVWSLARSFAALGLAPEEVALISAKLFELWSAPPAHWDSKLEQTTWWNFIEADGKSNAYQTYFANIGVRSTVAMDPMRASARTIGRIVLRLVSDLVLHSQGKGPAPDRWLNGPTNEAWIEPWVEYLTDKGVNFALGKTVAAIVCEKDELSRVDFEDGTTIAFSQAAVDFQYGIIALPMRALSRIVERPGSVSLWSSAPSLRRLKSLLKHNEWMLGMQFYLNEEVALSPGGMFLKDSPWAITVVSQTQFWTKKEFNQAKTILSVIISNWNAPGDYHGQAAKYSTVEQVRDEVWRELKAHFNDTPVFPGAKSQTLLNDRMLLGFRVNNWDFTQAAWVNDEELFVNGVGSWEHRPEVKTDVRNLFLAGDYVRTSTDLATMESANEAARLAVNAILFDAQSPERPCDIWPFEPVPPDATVALAQALGGVASDAARRAVHASSGFFSKMATDWISRRRR